MLKKNKKETVINKPLYLNKLDLGCGPNKIAPDWIGADCRSFNGVDVVTDLTKKWPWENASIDEVHCSHFIEHLDANERIHFVNELYRILKPGAKATIIAPHWSSCRAYGDLTHKWPPVSEFWFSYLSTEWRTSNAPHNDQYKCNFKCTWGFSLRQDVLIRNQDYQFYAMTNYKDVLQDVIATFVKE